MRLKVGDKVEYVKHTGGFTPSVPIGTTGVISDIDSWKHGIRVEFEEENEYGCKKSEIFSESELKVIE